MSDNTNAAYQIREWFSNSPEKVETVRNRSEDRESMKLLHVHQGSYLGEITEEYLTITLCEGYFNLLCGKGENSIVDINALDEKGMPQLFPGALLIAYDRTGNVFALNSGACRDADMGKVLYLPKDSFVWENLDISYAQFLKWVSSVTMTELLNNGWKSEIEETAIGNFSEYLMGKAAAYNMFLRQGG